jgi:hypothetical protein
LSTIVQTRTFAQARKFLCTYPQGVVRGGKSRQKREKDEKTWLGEMHFGVQVSAAVARMATKAVRLFQNENCEL